MFKRDKEAVPVSVGQKLELVCESLGGRGDGIFKYNGFVIVVPFVEVNKMYVVRVTKVLSNMAFGEVIGDD